MNTELPAYRNPVQSARPIGGGLNEKPSASAMSDLMSRADAAAYLGVKPQTLAVWATTRRYDLPMIKIGRLAKYRRSDLEAFIAARTVGGESCER